MGSALVLAAVLLLLILFLGVLVQWRAVNR
jgi:hypothetical protein